MALPDGFLNDLRSRVSLAQVASRKVSWDMRKSQQGKGDWWAPCPFHQEKTASFHVDDRKGYYYCFGCHAKGDVFGFVKETENVSFMEAVEILAREAGMEMPARDPKAQQRSDRRTQLAEVMEQAVQFFRLRLKSAQGAAARAYLSGRGLDEAALERWEIGFAPEGWQTLWDHLRGKGMAEELILACGLARPSQKPGKPPYDTFRNRIMFPIRDARGRAIAFGGRAMDPNDNAKYLNSPETELFDKSRTLFNHGPARAAAGKGQPVIVAEGYMDVIALAEAGFEGAVAPLGTALTEHQLQLLWRMTPEPVIALDGDRAGVQAAFRAIDLALPLLEAGKSLRIALMPEGKDPDDLLRAEGAQAVRAVLDAAQPIVALLWRRATEGKLFDSPERKAALEKELMGHAARIKDPLLRRNYERDLKDRSWQLFRQSRPAAPSGRGARGSGFRRAPFAAPAAPMPTTLQSALVRQGEAAEIQLCESIILAALIANPEIVDEVGDRLADLDCADPDHRHLRDTILRHAGQGPEALRAAIRPEALEKLHALRHVAICPCVRTPGDAELALMTVESQLAKLKARRGLHEEIEEAMGDMDGAADEAVTFRLRHAAEAHLKAERSQQEDKTEYEIARNGARISKAERDRLDELLRQLDMRK